MHSKRFTWKRVILLFLLIWCFLPVLLPDDYSGLGGREREVAKSAIEEAETELTPPVWKYKVISVEEIGEDSWRVDLVGYTFFHIPVEKGEITPGGGSFKEYFPGAEWVQWIAMAILVLSVITLFTIPLYLIYLLFRKFVV